MLKKIYFISQCALMMLFLPMLIFTGIGTFKTYFGTGVGLIYKITIFILITVSIVIMFLLSYYYYKKEKPNDTLYLYLILILLLISLGICIFYCYDIFQPLPVINNRTKLFRVIEVAKTVLVGISLLLTIVYIISNHKTKK